MKTWNRFLSASLGSLLLAVFACAAFGQGRVDQYTTTTFNAGWNDISGSGSQFGFNAPWGGYGTTAISLPFDFVYDKTMVSAGSDVITSPDGSMSLGGNNPDAYNTTILGQSSFPGAICFMAGGATAIGDGNGIDNSSYYETDGTAPNRVFTIQFDHVHFQGSNYYNGNQGSGDGGANPTDIQVKLYETTGVIEFIYMDHDNDFVSSYNTYDGIGLNGFNTPLFASNTYGTNLGSTPSTDLRFSPPLPPAELSLEPKTLNFGTVVPSVPDTMCVTASSVGANPLHVTGFSITGSSAYSIVSGPPIGTQIDPGSSVQYCIQFEPFGPGALSGAFTLNTDGADSGTQIVNLTGIGAVPLISYGVTNLFHRVATELGDTSQTEYIPFTSIGQGPLKVNSVYFYGLDASNYFVSYLPAGPLAPGTTDSIGIRFAPTIEGRPDAHVVINTNATNIPSDTIPLFGVGTLPHLVITVSPPGSGNTVMINSVAIGDSVCQTITLSNTGTDTLEILKQIVTYGDYDFTFHPLAGTDTMILPGASKLLNICFKPLKNGTREASIRFYTSIPLTFESPQRDTSQFPVFVTGVGVPYGHLTINGQLIDTAEVGKTNCITQTLTNNGQSDLTISKVAITGPGSTAFTMTGATLPLTLAPGQSQVVTICFTASARGTQFDTLLLSGTTSEKSLSQSLLLEGVGVIACVSADSMIVFDAPTDMTPVGAVDTTCITVSNCGDIATTYTASTPTGAGYTLVSPAISSVIPAGGTTQFCVAFQPTAIGAASGSVTITGGPFPATTLLGGVGAGVAATALGAPAAPVATDTCNSFDVTITNTGNIAWTPGAGSITGPDMADFTITNGPTPATIAPGGTATVTINFCPKTVGSESMTLTFPGESPTPVAGAFSFTTTGVGAQSGVTIRTEQDGFSLGQSFPNPTNGTADVTVTLPHDASVRIDLIDATGQVMKTAFSGNLAAGSQSIQLGCKGLPSGTYFYTLTSGDVRLARQLILVK